MSALQSFHLCRRPLFQRKKRSVTVKKKTSRKSVGKAKAKTFKRSAAKRSSAKRVTYPRNQLLFGYQATAPQRGGFRVNVHPQKKFESHQDFPTFSF